MGIFTLTLYSVQHDLKYDKTVGVCGKLQRVLLEERATKRYSRPMLSMGKGSHYRATMDDRKIVWVELLGLGKHH